jgi:phosphate transport system protein
MNMSNRLEGHTFRRFDGELYHLHTEILKMAGLVYEQILLALESLLKQNLDAVRVVNEREIQVDALEKTIDSNIVEILARRTPLARDLRAIMAFSKAVTDLERLGDEATKISYIASSMYNNDHSNPSNFLLRDVDMMGKVGGLPTSVTGLQHWATNLQEHADPATPGVDGRHFRYSSTHPTAFPF